MGVDPGIADTGYGFIIKDCAGKISALDFGSIKTAAIDKLPDRLYFLYWQLKKKIEKYHPQIIAVEQLFFAKNTKTALTVAQARGVILLLGKEADLTVEEYTPLQIKQAISAYGRAGKMQMQKMVQFLLALDDIPRPDDAADALAAAICSAQTAKFFDVKTKHKKH